MGIIIHNLWKAPLPFFFLVSICYNYFDYCWLLSHSIVNIKTQSVSIFYLRSSFWLYTPFIAVWSTFFPHPSSKLWWNMHSRVIKLNRLIWPYILNENQSYSEIDDSASIDACCSLPQPMNYKPKLFWLSLMRQILPPSILPQMPTSEWSLFWNPPVLPESRPLWYPLFHRKLYDQVLLSRLNNSSTLFTL